LTIQVEVFSILIISGVLGLAFVYLGNKVKQLDPYEKPSGIAGLAVDAVSTLRNVVLGNMGKRGENYAPYISTIFIFIFISNMSGLLGLPPPTANFSVTLSFGLITWFFIQRASIKSNGFGGYIKGFFEPIVPFVIPNIFGQIAPLISLSVRLFGNIIGGGVIMSLLYTFLNYLNGILLPWLKLNVLGIIVAPVLHAYFDIFSAFLQAFIFISLTAILTSVEYPEEN
jgi:F-type H+-transporting ATPase subunit a